MKVCSMCNSMKNETDFYKFNRNGKVHLRAHCIDCAKQYKLRNKEAYSAIQKIYNKNNKERIAEIHREYYQNNKPRFKELARKNGPAWRLRTKEIRNSKRLKWESENKERASQLRAKWRQNNRARSNELAQNYRASKLFSTPKWANEFFMTEAYDLAIRRTRIFGFPWEVDHIVPLQNKLVCGFHSEHNLQVIPRAANRKKSNKVWPDMPVQL